MNATFDVLPSQFFEDETLRVTRTLLGQRLVRRIGDEYLVGRIVEAEAYGGADDSTSHVFRGPTPRAAGMFGPIGRAYVYMIYGMYSCFNVVAHPPDGVGAVLVRALVPELGVERMHEHRGAVKPRLLANGPGRLCMALGIDRSCNSVDLCDAASPVFLARGVDVPDHAVVSGPRVGVKGRPDDVARPWRLLVVPAAQPSLNEAGYISNLPSLNNT